MKEVNVYFVSDGEYIKIGISNNLKSRLSGIQTGNARKLSLEHSISCDDYRQAQALEKILHEHFSSFHVSGATLAYKVILTLLQYSRIVQIALSKITSKQKRKSAPPSEKMRINSDSNVSLPSKQVTIF